MTERPDLDDDLSAAPPTADTVDALIARAVEAPPTYPTLAEGTVVADRYEVEGVIGAGGMGTVYLARDRQLDRPVALKLHRTPAADRLRREALAMAKLAHPNVVTVFEIGEFDGRPFVAMEYISGASLRQWLESTRTPREILTAVFAAGDGLVAAHAAGLVHRDVKPDNIFVGDDGRVRFGDFGLAQLGGSAEAPVRVPLGKSTATGSVIGTPAYMAPEQIEGGELDARTDQFAFCVVVWEALGGVRPFGGADTQELHQAIQRGEPDRPKRRVPPLIRRVLERGFAADPAARWASIGALLAALRSAERRPRLTAIAVGAALAVGAATAWSLAPAADPVAACKLAGDDIDARVPAALVDGAVATAGRANRANASEETRRIRKHTDDFRAGYRELAGITCQARERGQWTDASYAASTECARLRAAALRALLDAAADPAIQPGNALELVARAPSLHACGDPRLVAGWRWLVSGAHAGDDVIAARAQLEAAGVLIDLGELAHARRIRDDVAIATLAATNPDLARRLALLRATLAGAEPELARVLEDARAAGDVEVSLGALAQLIELAGFVRHDRPVAERWIGEALGEVKAFASRSPREAFDALVTAARATGALAGHERAVELTEQAERLGVPDEPRRLALLEVRGDAQIGTHNSKRAGDTIAALVERASAAYGPGHPRVAHALAVQAVALANLGREPESLAATRTAVKIVDDDPGDRSHATALASKEIGARLLESDDMMALKHFDRARAIWLAARDEHYPLIADLDINVAPVWLATKNPDRALALLRNATQIQTRRFGPDHPELVTGLYNLAVAERAAGELDGALATLRRSLAILERHEPGTQLHMTVLLMQATIFAQANRHDDALAAATTALEMDPHTDLQTPAWARFEVARALVALKRDRPRALELLRDARRRYDLLKWTERVAEIDKIIASLR